MRSVWLLDSVDEAKNKFGNTWLAPELRNDEEYLGLRLCPSFSIRFRSQSKRK